MIRPLIVLLAAVAVVAIAAAAWNGPDALVTACDCGDYDGGEL